MDNGFKVALWLVITVALVYAGLSVWPVLSGKTDPRNNPQPLTATAPTQQALPSATPSTNTKPPAQPVTKPPQKNQGATVLVPSSPASQTNPGAATQQRATNNRPGAAVNPAAKIAGELSDTYRPPVDWKYAKNSVLLRMEPGGVAYIPTCLNKSPLLIVRGSRLEPILSQGDWVMVRSPGQMLGWVPETELADIPPMV